MEIVEIIDQITPIFHDVFDDEDIVLSPESTAADIAEWDSLNHIRLVLSVEKHFGIRFSASEIGGLANVGDFARLVQSKL
jgi:acyl carrier protein